MDDYLGQVPCEVCGKKGYYKHGVCAKCRQPCRFCGGKLNGPKGTTAHTRCLKKVRHQEAGTGHTPAIEFLFADTLKPS